MDGQRREAYLEEVERYLNASAGAYRMHRACIELDERFQVFDPGVNTLADLKLAPELPVFVHEYAHYIQNYSTAAGVTEFVLWSYILGAYSRCLGPSATVVTPPEKSETDLVAECISHLRLLQGELGPGRATYGEVRFVSSATVDVAVTLNGNPISFPAVELTFRAEGQIPPIKVRAGTILLFEGLAYEIESWVSDVAGNAAGAASFFPYGVLREVALGFGVQHRLAFVAMGILASNSRFPWPTLLAMFEAYRLRAPAPTEVHAFLREMADDHKGERDGLIDVLLGEELPGLIDMFRERGAVEAGMQFVVGDMANMLKRRKTEPVFELQPFSSNKLDFDRLKLLLASCPPCDVMQCKPGPWDVIGRDHLLTFQPESRVFGGMTYSQGVRALEAQLSNMMAHIRRDSIVVTSQLQGHRKQTCCPFFAACPLQRRQDKEAQCADEPWLHFRDDPGLACWYSSGIAGTLGTVQVVSVLT